MRKFLVRFGLWLLILGLVAVAFDAMITWGLRNSGVREYVVWDDILKGGIDADVIVIGSSQAWCSYNTFVLDSMLNVNSYNLGMDGHTLPSQLLRYETYRRFNAKPKVILLNVCFYGTFGLESDEQYEREQFFPFFSDDTLIDKVSKMKHITWFDKNIPLYRYFGYRDDIEIGLKSFFGETDFIDGGLHKGYRGNDWGWASTKSMGLDSIWLSPDEKSAGLLERFARDCYQDSTTLVFVKYPMYHFFVEKVNGIGWVDSLYCSISEKYNVYLLDYASSEITYDTTCYYNFSHLNKEGAERFTTMLCHDLDTLRV